MKDRILSLLGSGLQPALVASAVGCSPSLISQMLADENFVMEVSALRVKDIEKMKERDNKWDNLEDLLLQKLQDLIPFMLRPREVIHALSIVNGARRRSEELTKGPTQQVTNNIVVLQLPQRTVSSFSNFELSKNNEVISIEGKSVAPLPSSALLRELSSQEDLLKQQTRTGEKNVSTEKPKSLPARNQLGRAISDEEIERTSFEGCV